VLLCDTADEVARLQYHMLREAPDLEVEVTTDAFRAVEATARTRPDVVVCDLGMEGVGGPELVRRLCAVAPSTRVIARALSLDPSLIAETLAAGAAAYLTRNDGPNDVVAAIRSVEGGAVVLSGKTAVPFGMEVSRTLASVRELQEELVTLRDEVRQGTSSKADFLANVSHELRTPITVAKGIAYVLRNPNVPTDEREGFLDQLQTSLDKLMGIVDELITLAEFERGSFELELSSIDLSPLVRHAVDETRRSYPTVTIVDQVPAQLTAFADGARLGGVVHELLDNACRYSQSGGTVELVARVLDEGVVVTVTDRGEGLDRAMLAQAFDQPFSTGEETLRKERSGIGVGLHLAHQVVVEHGGIMWSDPLPGGGTRVSFCIPASEGARVAAPPIGAA
jgi:signal transduction histidine kinase